MTQQKFNTLVPFAKSLRKNATNAEQLLWKHLRAKRFAQFKFRRQTPIDCFIVDFVCFEKRIIIECDGGHHLSQPSQDQLRESYLSKEGFRILRFWNHEIIKNTHEVLNVIFAACQNASFQYRPFKPEQAKHFEF